MQGGGGPTRRPVKGADSLTRGKFKNSTMTASKARKDMDPDNNWGLGTAKVVNIDYEDLFVTLRTLTGVSEMFERVPIPLTFPGAGARHFLGALPEIGDICVVGWKVQESKNTTKTPVVLSWQVPGVWAGREWVTTSDFEVDEFDLSAPKDRTFTEGAFSRVRHKLRHMQPGMVMGSSSQGSDLVLDESVLLSNRRGNEFRLRDQDQAVVTRALQRFDALAGVRSYQGMVQRDANLLAPDMISDGQVWDGPLQSFAGDPLSDTGLPQDPVMPDGFLKPCRMLGKTPQAPKDGYLSRSALLIDSSLDPYTFLRNGGFLNEAGMAVDDSYETDTSYGGKDIFRVAQSRSKVNAAGKADQPTMTEYRVEVCHTSTGRLPVTEQTDGFDAERLPETDLINPFNNGLGPNSPFIESVLGTVVGNDPFTQKGRTLYGLPLVAKVFDGDQPVPRLEAIELAPEGSAAVTTPVSEQAATLFKLTPPLVGGGAETWWSLNKQGQMKATFGGDPKGNSIEAYLRGGLKLGVGGAFQLLLNGHIGLESLSKGSVDVAAREGAVHIYGGGPVKNAESLGQRMGGTGNGEADLPAVDIESATNARLRATKQVVIKAREAITDATSIALVGHETVLVDAVKKLSMSTESLQMTVNGKRQDSYSGPKQLLKTNGPLHERTYSPNFPGVVCEKVDYNLGDREETFTLGNHTTTIKVGDMTYQTLKGTWKGAAVGSSLEMSSSGISAKALLGTVSVQAVAGMATVTALSGVTLQATAGLASVRGSAGVYLGAPITGPDSGPILCAGSREPFTNIPFAVLGTLGAQNHIVGP